MLKNKWVIASFASILLITGLAGCKQNDDTAEINSSKPVKTLLIAAIKTSTPREFQGKVAATQNVDLAFQVDGKLTIFPINEGEAVKKGQMLAQLEQGDYQDALHQAESKYNLTQTNLQRSQELVGKGFISQVEHDKIQSNFDIAKADLSVAKRNMDYTTLRAPFDGTVTKKFVDLHEYIQPKEAILRLQDTTEIDIEIDVPENIILNIQNNERSADPSVTFPSAPDKHFKASFKEISTEADADTQTYKIVFTLAQPEGINALPGMNAVVRVNLPDFKSGGTAFFEIRANAVFEDDNKQSCVWLVDGSTMTLRKQTVKVTRMSGNQIRITEGLDVGDRVVVAGVHYLKEGEAVTLMEE